MLVIMVMSVVVVMFFISVEWECVQKRLLYSGSFYFKNFCSP